MAANRFALSVTDPNGTSGPIGGGPQGTGQYNFAIAPNGKGGRDVQLTTNAWEPGDPANRVRLPIHPWSGGLRQDRVRMVTSSLVGSLVNRATQTYMKGNCDASYPGLLLFPPKINAVTMTNGNLPAKQVEFNSLVFFVGGRYMYYFDPSNNTVTEDKDFGAGKAAVDAAVFNNELVVAMGETEKIWKRTTTTWSQATDATYAIALGTVDSKLWRAETTNKLSSCSTTPLTLTSWTPASPNQYTAGDTTYAVNKIVDYGGIPWVMKADGAYAPDPKTRFINQAPQLARYPHISNGVGAFVAHASLFVPSAAGLLQLKPGSSKVRGPELTGRPDFRFWTRGGVEWGNAIYLICDDLSATSNTTIIKMVRDEEGISGNEYIYHEWAGLGATTAGYGIGVSSKGTQPKLIFGFGNNMRYIDLGRGGGRDIDDGCFLGDTYLSMESLPTSLTRRWYAGELTEITTAGGHKLAGTPNHPILTDRGWVALSLLKEGDHVAHDGRLIRPVTDGHPDIEQRDPTLRELFDLASVGTAGHRRRLVRENFHGDGQEGEVDIKPIDGELRNWLQARLLKPSLDQALVSGNLPQIWTNLSLLSTSKHDFVGRDLATTGLPDGGEPENVLLMSGVSMSQESCFREGTQDSTLLQNPINSVVAHPELPGDAWSGFAGEVALCDVVSVRRYPFSGYVYNLETESHRYGANGIVAHNSYNFGTAMTLESGPILPGADMSVLFQPIGVTTMCKFANAGETLTVAGRVDGTAYADLLDSQEGGNGVAAITGTTDYQAVTRYFTQAVSGQFVEIRFTGALTSGAGTTRPEIKEAWVFGYLHPRVTDTIKIGIVSSGQATINGIRVGMSRGDISRAWRSWMDAGTVLLIALDDYDEGNATRFIVTAVDDQESGATLGTGATEDLQSVIQVQVQRVDFANQVGA